MALASTRPVMRLAESLRLVASLGGGRPWAWWLAILTVARVGSFITEPAAMTIAALLLAKQFYGLKPSAKLMYATLGLLFVNISIGGTLTHFAAPPVLMVAAAWVGTWPTCSLTSVGTLLRASCSPTGSISSYSERNCLRCSPRRTAAGRKGSRCRCGSPRRTSASLASRCGRRTTRRCLSAVSSSSSRLRRPRPTTKARSTCAARCSSAFSWPVW